MNVLGIETSCDETAAAVVRDGSDALSNVVSSQIATHAAYGGVVPELAAREHLRAITPVVDAALAESGCTVDDVDAVAVTSGPGLIPALLVGVAYAKGLAAAGERQFLGVNHFVAHIFGAFLEEPDLLSRPDLFPVLALVVSGGHTALVLIARDGAARIVGRTLDDAAGEAFDKAAKILDLGYPGGPVIDRIAADGDPKRVAFPRGLTGSSGRPVRDEDRLNFSFSGVKTALLYAVRDRALSQSELTDVVASYQAAIVDVLVDKTILAAAQFNAATVVLCGGVACNSSLRAAMTQAVKQAGRGVTIAARRFCTDNAAMVAGVAYHYLRHGCVSGLDLSPTARLNLALGTVPFAPDAEPGLPQHC